MSGPLAAPLSHWSSGWRGRGFRGMWRVLAPLTGVCSKAEGVLGLVTETRAQAGMGHTCYLCLRRSVFVGRRLDPPEMALCVPLTESSHSPTFTPTNGIHRAQFMSPFVVFFQFFQPSKSVF